VSLYVVAQLTVNILCFPQTFLILPATLEFTDISPMELQTFDVDRWQAERGGVL
jgi:hypothetical protein